MPLSISVVIPTYNRSPQVVAAVRSVLLQTLPPSEILVVDDGSTDDTCQALSCFVGQIRYLKIPNGGASAARNRGVRESAGDWIAFLDSDDTWHSEKLARQVATIAKTGAKVCYCVSTDESGEPLDDLNLMDGSMLPGEDRFYQAGDCRIFKHQRHPFVQSMLVWKRALLKVGLFDESLKVAEDTKLIYELTYEFGYAVVNERYVNICRERDGPGLSDTMDPVNAHLRHDCYLRVQSEAYWRLLPLDLGAAARAKGNMLYFISRQSELACALGKKALAKRYAMAGLTTGNTLKSIVRSLLILLVYPVAEKIFIKKWGTVED